MADRMEEAASVAMTVARPHNAGIGTVVGKCPEFLNYLMQWVLLIDIGEAHVVLASLVRRRLVVWSRVNHAWRRELEYLQRALQPALFRTSPFQVHSCRYHLWRASTETFTRAATAATADPGAWWEYICGLQTEIFFRIPDEQEPGEFVWTTLPGLLGDGGFTMRHEYPFPVGPGDVLRADGLYEHVVLDIYPDEGPQRRPLKGCPVLYMDTVYLDLCVNGHPLPRTQHPTVAQAGPGSEVKIRKFQATFNPVTGRMDLLALGPERWYEHPEFCAVIRFPLSTPGMRHAFGSMNYHLPDVLLCEDDLFVSFRALSCIASEGRTHAVWMPTASAAGAGHLVLQ